MNRLIGLIFIVILQAFSGFGYSCEEGEKAFTKVLNDRMNGVVKKSDQSNKAQKISHTIKLSLKERSQIRSTPKAEEFKKIYAKSTLEFDNRSYIRGVKDVPKGKKAIYFDVENSVLKQLNDEIFETKDLGDAAGNLFNRIMYKKIKSNPQLSGRLDGQYRDFKSMRFSFLIDETDDGADIMAALKKVYKDSASEFGKQLKETGLGPLWSTRTGQTGNPERWFLAGVGDTPLEANMGARQARTILKGSPGGSSGLVKYSDRIHALSTEIKGIESIREGLRDVAALRKANIMVDAGNGKMVLSKDAIGILRKTKRDDFTNLKEYRTAVNGQFKKLFGTKVDDKHIDGMTKYFEGVDSLSPPLFVRSRAGIDLSQANKGLVSVDFTGVGVDNAYEAMIGLAKTSGVAGDGKRFVSNALKAVDQNVGNVTASMNKSKIAFNNGTKGIAGKPKPAIFSGDDGMYFPDKAWTRAEKQKLVDNLGAGDPGKYRVTFVETTYKDGKVIPTELRSEYIVRAEKVEKAIRKNVTGLSDGQISPERAHKMMIAIEFRPGGAKPSEWDILLGGSYTPKEATIIREAMRTALKSN